MPSTFRELEAILTLDGKLKDCQNELKDCRDELEDSRSKFKVLREVAEKKLASNEMEIQTLRNDNENLKVEKMQLEDKISRQTSRNDHQQVLPPAVIVTLASAGRQRDSR